jgi:hypothetical protein
MVVDDLNIFYVRACPAKAYSKLIVHSNAVLASSITFEGFQPVTRWNT